MVVGIGGIGGSRVGGRGAPGHPSPPRDGRPRPAATRTTLPPPRRTMMVQLAATARLRRSEIDAVACLTYKLSRILKRNLARMSCRQRMRYQEPITQSSMLGGK